MSEIRLSLLGPPNLTRDNAPLKIGRRKAFALLSYLAVTHQPQRRESLATLFWPDSGSSLAFSYLRRDLAVINKALGPGWLEADREQVTLIEQEGLRIDVLAFRQLLQECQAHGHPIDKGCPRCIPLLSEAAALYRGEFMMGFSLPDSHAFDDWQRFEQETLRHDMTCILGILIEEHSAQGQYQEGISYARRWLQLAPWDEAAHRWLMQLYTWGGDRSAALRQYQECVRLLDNELDQPPGENTHALFEAIQSGEALARPSGSALHAATAARPLDARRSLPPQTSAFVNRKAELAELKGLLVHEAACRMITLAGPEGTGKTRLALWAAETVMESFPHGVYVVPLTSIHDVDLLAPTIAGALKLTFQGRTEPKAQLLNYLREKRILLVLDNMHGLGRVDLLPEILQQAPGVKLLITSRERLSLRAEWVRSIQGLEYPPADSTDDAVGERSFQDYSAVQLFLERVQRASPDIRLEEQDRAAVLRICQAVEGLPLALELGATWAREMALPEIAAEIQRSLEAQPDEAQLTETRPAEALPDWANDPPERHRIVRALFERSWQLLTEPEQHALQRLSVFQGGFTREAAARVSKTSPLQLISLVDKSMLRAHPSGRYDMHELLHRFVTEKLVSTPDVSQEVHAAHCRYYCTFLREREDRLKGAAQREALDEISADIDNVRAAWRWAIEHALTDEIARGLESLYLFYYARGWVHEGQAVYRKALDSLEASGTEQTSTRALVVGRLQARSGRFAYRRGRHRQARELLRRSLVTYAQIEAGPPDNGHTGSRSGSTSDKERRICGEKAFSLFSLSVVVRGDGEYKKAQHLCWQSYELYRACKSTTGMAMALKVLGIISGSLDSYVEAQRQLQEALTLYQEVGDPYGIANTLNDLGFVAAGLDQNANARRYYQDSLNIRRQIGDMWGIGASLNNLGYLAYLDRSYSEAKSFLQESLFIQREIGDQYHIANCLNNLGAAASALGERYESATYLHEALRTAFEIGATRLVLEVLAAISTLLAESGVSDPEQAAKLMAFVLYHPLTDRWTQERTEKALVQIAPDLPLDALSKAQKKGQEGELDTVVVEVLSHRDAWLARNSQAASVIVNSL